MNEITAALTHTPTWVWALLAVLVFLGVRASRPGSATLAQLAILPTVFAIWGISSVLRSEMLTPTTVGLWLVGIAIGGALGYRLESRTIVQVDRTSGTLYLPGSWLPLIVTLVIFALGYALGYTVGRWPEMARDAGFVMTSMAASGMFLGLLTGRFVNLAARYRNA